MWYKMADINILKIDLLLILKWCLWFIEGIVYIINIVEIYQNY